MIRKMSVKLFKSPLKILLALVVAVSLFFSDFTGFDVQASGSSYTSSSSVLAFVKTSGHILSSDQSNYTYISVGTYYLYESNFSNALSRLSTSGSIYIAKHTTSGASTYVCSYGGFYYYCVPILYDPDNEQYYYQDLANKISVGTSSTSNKIDAQTQVLLDAIENSKTVIDPMLFNYYPSSTGMSYSTIVSNFGTNNSITISSPGYTFGPSGGICAVYYTLRSDNWPLMEPGSYLLNFLFGQVPPSSGSIPDVLVDRSLSTPLDVVVFNWSGTVVAFDRSADRHSYNFYLSSFMTGGFPSDLIFLVYYYVKSSVPQFTCTYSSNVAATLLSADSSAILDKIGDTSQAAIDAANKNADDIMHSYDKSAGTAANTELSGILTGMENAENETWSKSQQSIGAYVITDVLDFSAGLMSGLSLIYSFANSFFLASGFFSVIVSVLYCMAFLAIILGLWRFFRGS